VTAARARDGASLARGVLAGGRALAIAVVILVIPPAPQEIPMRSMFRLALLGSLLIPTLASAQPSPNDPDAASPTLAPPAQPPPAAPPPTVAPPQQPAQAPEPPAPPPTVVVAPAPLPEPSTYTPTERYEEVTDTYNAPIFTSGALVFAASYGASVIVAATDSGRGNDRLYVPVVGPWLALHDRGSCDITRASCDNETTAKVLLVADGVFQAAGLLGMIDGLLQPSTHRVVTRTTRLDTKVHVTPTLVAGDPGVGVFSRF
jgi:hypothetical protein